MTGIMCLEQALSRWSLVGLAMIVVGASIGCTSAICEDVAETSLSTTDASLPSVFYVTLHGDHQIVVASGLLSFHRENGEIQGRFAFERTENAFILRNLGGVEPDWLLFEGAGRLAHIERVDSELTIQLRPGSDNESIIVLDLQSENSKWMQGSLFGFRYVGDCELVRLGPELGKSAAEYLDLVTMED